ncbi:Uncharacterised protein [Segatella copri]|nr:Uncharacterised protein [Segatella copri]
MIPRTVCPVVVDTNKSFLVVVVSNRIYVAPVIIEIETICAVVINHSLSFLCCKLVIGLTFIERVTCHCHIYSRKGSLCSLLRNPCINTIVITRC